MWTFHGLYSSCMESSGAGGYLPARGHVARTIANHRKPSGRKPSGLSNTTVFKIVRLTPEILINSELNKQTDDQIKNVTRWLSNLTTDLEGKAYLYIQTLLYPGDHGPIYAVLINSLQNGIQPWSQHFLDFVKKTSGKRIQFPSVNFSRFLAPTELQLLVLVVGNNTQDTFFKYLYC